MRLIKIFVVLGLVVAFAVPASAITMPPTGPIKFIVEAFDSGTNYSGVPLGGAVVGPGALDALIPGSATGPLGGLPAGGAQPFGEDSWGVFQVKVIEDATIITQPPPGPGSINGPGGTAYWVSGAGNEELFATFWGEYDTSVIVDLAGTQTVTGTNVNFALWAQTSGAADAATTAFAGSTTPFGDLGSAARLGATGETYVGVGVPGGVAGATLWLTGTSTSGFFPGTLDPTASFLSVFNPGGLLPGGITGSSSAWLSVGPVDADGDGAVDDVGVMNSLFDTNFFLATDGSGTQADLSFQITTRGNNVSNTPGGGIPPKPPTFDWTVTTESGTVTGVTVPEPITMLGLLLGVGSLGGYIRRRRQG